MPAAAFEARDDIIVKYLRDNVTYSSQPWFPEKKQMAILEPGQLEGVPQIFL